MKKIFVLALLVASLIPAGLARAQGPLTTAFTYQGQLKQGGFPTNGLSDFEFLLFDNPAGTGTPLGTSPLRLFGVPVTDGIFTVELNFGAVFTSNRSWLQIKVGPAGTPLTTLSPLQELTPTPNAINAISADTLDGQDSTDFALSEHTHSDAQVPNNITIDFAQNAGQLGGLTKDAFALAIHPHPEFSVITDVISVVGGNIGIGTTSPVQKLDVSGGTALRGILFLGDGPTSILRKINSGSSFQVANSGGQVEFTVDGSGNVGIGTDTPAQKLKVFEASSAEFAASFINNFSEGGNGVFIGAGTSSADFALDVTDAVSNPLFVVKGNGKVGIGTTSPNPSYRLHVASPGLFVDANSGSSGLQIERGGGPIINFNVDSSRGFITTAASQPLIFQQGSSEVLRIHSNGNVGIGTTNPATKLHVIGTITGTVKNFEIDHPSKQGMKLVHSAIEGPEAAVFYRGAGHLVEGKAFMTMPDYFEALTRTAGRTVQLTARGTQPFLLSASEVKDGGFWVYGTNEDGRFYWEVKAVRADVEPVVVERESLSKQ